MIACNNQAVFFKVRILFPMLRGIHERIDICGATVTVAVVALHFL